MDLWVGIISEPTIYNVISGELGAHIIGVTFANLRNGDRFYFENNYPSDIIAEIRRTKLGDIV